MNGPLHDRIRPAAYTELQLENHEQIFILYCLTRPTESLCHLIQTLGGMVYRK